MAARFGCYLIAASLGLAAAHTAAAQDEKKGLAELQGIWKLVGFEIEGKPAEFPANLPRWVIKGDKVYYGGEELAVLTVDAATNPRSIDLDFRKSNRVDEGVYAVDGDMLKICVSKPSDGVKERPLDFATEGKPSRRLLVFQRQKPGSGDGTVGGPGFAGVQIRKGPNDEHVSVAGFVKGSPAEKAGLKKDDILLKVGGAPATDLKTVIDLVRQVKSGNDLTLSIRRGDDEREITVRVGVLPFMLRD